MKKANSGKSSTPKNKRSNTPKQTKVVPDQVPQGVEQVKQQGMSMDFESLRFAHFQPQAIEAMAVTSDSKLLAIARENNSIEIWLRDSWVQLLTIPGNKNCAIRNIHWLEKAASSEGDAAATQSTNPLYDAAGQARRLVTTGLNSVVLEWDLLTQAVKSKHSVNAAIWSSKLIGKHLYLACEDGTVKLLKVKKDSFDLVRQIMRAETKCLSLDVTADERFIFAGYADSSIRKWSLETGHCELHFVKQTKKAMARLATPECLILTLRLFGEDNVLFSGDSLGELTAWDTNHGTLIQTFNNLKADVTCIEVNKARGIVYATGVDARILSIQKDGASGQWVFLSLFRGQSNDIKSLIQLDASELISAGVNTDICVYKLTKDGTLGDQYGKNSEQQKAAAKLRHVPPFPQKSPIVYAEGLILLLNGSRQELEVYDAETSTQIIRIEKSGDYGIDSVAFDGRYIVYSDCKETQVFVFDREQLRLRKLTKKLCTANGIKKLPSSAFLALKPSQDGEDDASETQLIMVTKDLDVCSINLQSSSISQICNKATFEQEASEMRPHDQIVTAAHFNPISNRLVLAFASSDYFSVVDLSVKNELYWRLPALLSQGTPLVFASDMDKLLIGYDSNHVAVFDLLNRQIHEWTSSNLMRLPKNFLSRYNKFAGALQLSDTKYMLYTSYTYCTIDLREPVPETAEMIQNHPSRTAEGKQFQAQSWFDNLKLSQSKYLTEQPSAVEQASTSAETQSSTSSNMSINNKFKGILLMDLSTSNKGAKPLLRVFEHSWQQAISNFQTGAFVTKKFAQ